MIRVRAVVGMAALAVGFVAPLGVQMGGKPNIASTLKLARIVRSRIP